MISPLFKRAFEGTVGNATRLPFSHLRAHQPGVSQVAGVGGWSPAPVEEPRTQVQVLRPSRKALLDTIGEAVGLTDATPQDSLKELRHAD